MRSLIAALLILIPLTASAATGTSVLRMFAGKIGGGVTSYCESTPEEQAEFIGIVNSRTGPHTVVIVCESPGLPTGG